MPQTCLFVWQQKSFWPTEPSTTVSRNGQTFLLTYICKCLFSQFVLCFEWLHNLHNTVIGKEGIDPRAEGTHSLAAILQPFKFHVLGNYLFEYAHFLLRDVITIIKPQALQEPSCHKQLLTLLPTVKKGSHRDQCTENKRFDILTTPLCQRACTWY